MNIQKVTSLASNALKSNPVDTKKIANMAKKFDSTVFSKNIDRLLPEFENCPDILRKKTELRESLKKLNTKIAELNTLPQVKLKPENKFIEGIEETINKLLKPLKKRKLPTLDYKKMPTKTISNSEKIFENSEKIFENYKNVKH